LKVNINVGGHPRTFTMCRFQTENAIQITTNKKYFNDTSLEHNYELIVGKLHDNPDSPDALTECETPFGKYIQLALNSPLNQQPNFSEIMSNIQIHAATKLIAISQISEPSRVKGTDKLHRSTIAWATSVYTSVPYAFYLNPMMGIATKTGETKLGGRKSGEALAEGKIPKSVTDVAFGDLAMGDFHDLFSDTSSEGRAPSPIEPEDLELQSLKIKD